MARYAMCSSESMHGEHRWTAGPLPSQRHVCPGVWNKAGVIQWLPEIEDRLAYEFYARGFISGLVRGAQVAQERAGEAKEE